MNNEENNVTNDNAHLDMLIKTGIIPLSFIRLKITNGYNYLRVIDNKGITNNIPLNSIEDMSVSKGMSGKQLIWGIFLIIFALMLIPFEDVAMDIFELILFGGIGLFLIINSRKAVLSIDVGSDIFQYKVAGAKYDELQTLVNDFHKALSLN